MRTGIRKKGKIALAWVICATMVFASMSTPFAYAQDSTLDLNGITKVDSFNDQDPSLPGIQKIIPAENDFVFIKQGTVANNTFYLWTKDPLSQTDKQAILDYVIAQPGASDDASTLTNVNFIWGFGTFTVTPKHGAQYDYTFSQNPTTGDIVLTFDKGKISHFYYGQYDQSYEINVTKLVTLNEEPTNLVNGTFYVSLFKNADYTGLIGTKGITVKDGVALAEATFSVSEQGTYYVTETDADGNLITAPGTLAGYHLISVENNHPDGITVTSESSNDVTITNNFEFHSSGTGSVDVDKVLTGKKLAAGMFGFTITQTDSHKTPITGGYSQTVNNEADGTVPFSPIHYETKGTYYYLITENAPADGFADGVTYDTHSVFVTMNVADIGDGVLVGTPTYEGSTAFENDYSASGTGTVEVSKILTGKALTEDMFSFTLTETNKNWQPLQEGYTQTVSNAAAGSIPFDSITYDKPGTYYYSISENIPNDAVNGVKDGITYDQNAIHVTMVVTDDGAGNLEATPSYDGGQTFNNAYKAPGSITVTKDVVVLSDDESIKVTYDFYAALFTDQEGQMIRATDVKKLSIVGSQSTSVTFDNLDLNKTYYVFETDADGNIIQTEKDGTIVNPIIDDWTHIIYGNAEVALTPENAEGSATITNVFKTDDFFLYGSITIKKTVTVNDKPTASNRTFYVGLFSDKELTTLVSDVKALKMNGKAKTSVEFMTDKDGNPLLAGDTYYIAETDKNGVAISDPLKQLGCTVDIDKPSVVITEEGTTVNIINQFEYSEEHFPLTGDNSNMNLWLFLAMIGVAGVLAPFAFGRKEKADN